MDLIERLRTLAGKFGMAYADLDTIEEAAAALEAAREDADRYRWLRDVGMRGWWVVSRQAERGGVYQQAPESIDAAIDHARGKGVPGA